ncbi:MAG: hypothetical protein FJX77_05050 [Armatimonadetes bacterium]|nr:hypothetical protein [Armatimonadota bacterium]
MSTALWNAAALAGLETEERHAHARVPRYSSPGRDATLNYPNLDLKFKNNTGAALVIRAQVRAGLVTIHVLGVPQAETYRLETEAQAAGTRLHVVVCHGRIDRWYPDARARSATYHLRVDRPLGTRNARTRC